MSLQIAEAKDKKSRIISDSANPRIWYEEWKCTGCGEWIDQEDVVWAKPDGELDTDTGDPYCDSCIPEEDDERPS